MKFLRVFKLNVGTLYLADGKNQVAYFQIPLSLLAAFPSFSPSRIPQHSNNNNNSSNNSKSNSHISFAKNLRFLSAFYAFFRALFCGICVCKVENFIRFLFLFHAFFFVCGAFRLSLLHVGFSKF